MKWIEPKIESICTTEIIYFSTQQKKTCERICKKLKIDLFPDADRLSYWNLFNSEWEKKTIIDDQTLKQNIGVFDVDVINKLKSNNSNILFCYDNDFLSGIFHFSNFNVSLIYQSLYQNFYTFETNLREYLSTLNYDYVAFEKYYEYQITKSKNEKKSLFYSNKLNNLRLPNFQIDAKKLRPLQKLELKELLYFLISPIYNPLGLNKIILSGTKVEAISDLRNTVMHSKDFIGTNENDPFEFKTFEKFFNQVLDFKSAFACLHNLRFIQINEQKIRFNQYLLQQVNEMNDSEIEGFFYNRL